MSMAEYKFKLKLTIDNHRKRVLFAEAEKDCVDFLFSILSLPVSNLIRLLEKDKMVGALPNLYESVETLTETFFQPKVTKDTVLKLPANKKKLYGCSKRTGHRYVSEDPRAACPKCGYPMNVSVSYVDVGDGGIVKDVTYMVVKPMSTVSFLALIIQFEIKNASNLEEKVVYVGKNEVIKLLKTSLATKNVLTSVFFNVDVKKEQT